MASAEELIEQWLEAGRKLLDAQKGSAREEALEKRLADLEAKLAAKPADEQEEAFEELDEEEMELVKQHRLTKGATPTPTKDEPEPEPVPSKTRPGRKSGQVYPWGVDESGNVVRYDIPTVYSGPDEDDEVELPAEATAA